MLHLARTSGGEIFSVRLLRAVAVACDSTETQRPTDEVRSGLDPDVLDVWGENAFDALTVGFQEAAQRNKSFSVSLLARPFSFLGFFFFIRSEARSPEKKQPSNSYGRSGARSFSNYPSNGVRIVSPLSALQRDCEERWFEEEDEEEWRWTRSI